MIEIIFNTLVVSMLIFGLVVFIKMRRRMPKILKPLYQVNVESPITEIKDLVKPEITKSKLQQV